MRVYVRGDLLDRESRLCFIHLLEAFAQSIIAEILDGEANSVTRLRSEVFRGDLPVKVPEVLPFLSEGAHALRCKLSPSKLGFGLDWGRLEPALVPAWARGLILFLRLTMGLIFASQELS